MVKCYVCCKEHSRFLSRQFHRFPTNAERREKWFNSIGFTVNAYKTARICSDHFTQDDYYTGSSIKLKKTAIPSVFTQRSCNNIKKDSRINIENDNQNEAIIFKQEDIQHHCGYSDTMDIQQSTIDIPHDNQDERIIFKQENKHEYAMDIQQSTIDIPYDNQDEAIIFKQEAIQYASTIDIQSTIDVPYNNIVMGEPTLVKKNTNQRREQHNINDKVSLKTGKYNIECIRKTDFTTDQAWNKFIKYINYNRYLQKLSVIQKSLLEKKIVAVQSILKTLRVKNFQITNLLTNNVESALKVDNL